MGSGFLFLSIARFITVLMPLTFMFGPAVQDVGLSLIIALFLVHCATEREWEWLRVRWVQIALVLGLYLVIRNCFVPNPIEILPQALVWLRLPIFAAALAYGVLPDTRTEHWLARTSMLAVLLLVIDTLWQFYHGSDFLGRPTFMTEGYARLTGPFRTPHVGMTLVWILFPALAYTINSAAPRFPKQRQLGMLLLLGAAVAIFASGERMAWILLLFGVGLSVLLMPRARLLLIVTALLAGGACWQLQKQDLSLNARQVGATTQVVGSYWDSVYGRTWMSAVHIMHDYPVVGVGMKQFQSVCVDPKYGPNGAGPNELRCPLHPHNMYLAWFAENGFIGGGLMLAMLGCWVVIALREWRYWWKAPIATGLLIALVLRVFPISVTPNYMATWVVIPLWFYAGWLLALLREGDAVKLAKATEVKPPLDFYGKSDL